MKTITKIKLFVIKHLLNENEKCILNQSLNLQKEQIYKEASSGINCDYKEDIKEIETLLEICKNKLFN